MKLRNAQAVAQYGKNVLLFKVEEEHVGLYQRNGCIITR